MSQELIRIPSAYGHEDNLSRFIFKKLESWGLRPRSIPVQGYGPDVVAEIGPSKAASVILNGHMDTVEVMAEWKHDPFGARIEGGLLYGLGALDMKCGLACMMTALRIFNEQGVGRSARIAFQAVSAEEHTGMGTRVLVKKGLFKRAKAVIVGEGFGGLGVVTNGRRGASYYDISVEGKSAHGAIPELGINAITDAARIVDALSDMKPARSSTLLADDFNGLAETQTVLSISGGGDSLSVPERCSIHMVRFSLPGEPVDATSKLSSVVSSLKLKSKVQVHMRTGTHLYPSYLTPPDSLLVRAARASIKSYLDKFPKLVIGLSEADDNTIAHETGLPVICMGPGETGALARYHQPEEAISVAQIGPAARAIALTALTVAIRL